MRPNFSVHPVCCVLDRKMNDNFFDGLDELYHRAKFGEDCATRARCRCENMVFVIVFFLSRCEVGALFVRGVHSSNKQRADLAA